MATGVDERVEVRDQEPVLRLGGPSKAWRTVVVLLLAAGFCAGSLVGDDDWWLFDDTRLMTMVFDDEGRRIHSELITEENRVQQARQWQHLAVRSARGDNA